MSFQPCTHTKSLIDDCIHFLSCEISENHVNISDISVLNCKISNLTKNLQQDAITKIRKDKKSYTESLEFNKIQSSSSTTADNHNPLNMTESSNNRKKTKKRIVPEHINTLDFSKNNVHHVEENDLNVLLPGEAVIMYKETMDMLRKSKISKTPGLDKRIREVIDEDAPELEDRISEQNPDPETTLLRTQGDRFLKQKQHAKKVTKVNTFLAKRTTRSMTKQIETRSMRKKKMSLSFQRHHYT